MTFDEGEFLGKCTQPLIGFEPRRVALAVCKEIAMLHAEIAALKARLPEPEPAPEPARETGWAVVDSEGDPYTVDGFFFKKTILCGDHPVVWFDKAVASDFCNAIWKAKKRSGMVSHRPALLYKDTLEEVDDA